jgi:predicted nucleic acid-binding protein
LEQLFGIVFIPPAVWEEVAVEGGDRVEAGEVQQAEREGWLQVARPDGESPLVHPELFRLDVGEREAVRLALEKKASLIMDEAAGRKVARSLGVLCMGTLGVLIQAKSRGLIASVREELVRLQSETNFRFTSDLFDTVLRRVGEVDS